MVLDCGRDDESRPVYVPVDALQAVAKAVGHLEDEGVTGLYVEVVPGHIELKTSNASYGARTWSAGWIPL